MMSRALAHGPTGRISSDTPAGPASTLKCVDVPSYLRNSGGFRNTFLGHLKTSLVDTEQLVEIAIQL